MKTSTHRISDPIVVTLLFLILPFTSALSDHLSYQHSFSDDVSSERVAAKLYKNFIWEGGRVCACSGKTFFAFERNGSIAWRAHLNYTCNANITPVHGGTTKIYLVAENRVLKISPRRVGTGEVKVELFFGPRQGEGEGEKIVGISASLSSSCVLITVQNRGLFAYRLHGPLIWSAGPVLYQHGYRQGCRRNITECYFTSPPVIDHCEASIFMSNTVGELYSLSIHGHHFKWIRDLSSFGRAWTITPGNNGRLYVTVPDRALVLALGVSRGNVLWHGSVGPLSSADYEPVVDSNGWISYSSLDGFLYSFSPEGELNKFPSSSGSSYVIQVNPVLDCSGHALYISRTEMEGKTSHTVAEYTHVSAVKPKTVAFISLVPSSGSIIWFESDPSKFLFQLSQSDLKHFLLDERTLLTFFAVSRNGNPLACRSTSQKIASSCSKVRPKSSSIYTGNKKTITLFLLLESIVLVILAVLTLFCCVFWKKKKLQGLDLSKFLQKRRWLRSQKRAFDRMITEVEQRTLEEGDGEQVMEQLSNLFKGRESIKRKLSTTYSFGRDGEKSSSKSLRDGKNRSYSFQGSMKESVTIFHTISSDDDGGSSRDSGEISSLMEDADDDLSQDENVGVSDDAEVEEISSGAAEDDEVCMKPLFLEHSISEVEEEIKKDDGQSRSLRRRTVSFNG